MASHDKSNADADREQEAPASEGAPTSEAAPPSMAPLSQEEPVAKAGGKKRKKKTYTKPKKIGHKHKKRPKAILEYFNVDNTGKIVKLKIECEKCPPATYMADHPDRHTCGKCGNMFYKLTKDGKRLPIPKQNKPQVAVKAEAPAAKGKGKKK